MPWVVWLIAAVALGVAEYFTLTLAFGLLAAAALVASTMLALGTAVGIFVLVNSIGPPVASTATVLISVGPLMLGVQFLVLALVLDILEEPR